jgi:hypothetical protein
MKDVLLKLVLSSLAAQLSYGAFAAGIQDDDQRRKCRTVQGLTEIVRDIEEKTQGKVVLLTPRLHDGKAHFEMLVARGGQFQKLIADPNGVYDISDDDSTGTINQSA